MARASTVMESKNVVSEGLSSYHCSHPDANTHLEVRLLMEEYPDKNWENFPPCVLESHLECLRCLMCYRPRVRTAGLWQGLRKHN